MDIRERTEHRHRLRNGEAAARVARDVIRASGPDAVEFLQGQLSQDVEALAEGESAPTFLLAPTGRVDAWLRVVRRGDDELLLDVDGGWGTAVAERLKRFLLRTRCELEPLDWSCVAVRGPAGVETSSAVVVDPRWSGIDGVDLLGAEVELPQGLAECPFEVYEDLRIAAGVPTMGAEITDATLPAELGVVDRSVSFTKGCYVGQELVARIDSRGGSTPQRLCALTFESERAGAGARLEHAGQAIGRVTSVGWSDQGPIGLGLVHRKIVHGTTVTAVSDTGSSPVTVSGLPLSD